MKKPGMSDRAPADRSLGAGPAPSRDHAQDRRARILAGPLLPTLLTLTLPVIAVIAAQTFVAVLEAFWVSRLGTAAVAGVSS